MNDSTDDTLYQKFMCYQTASSNDPIIDEEMIGSACNFDVVINPTAEQLLQGPESKTNNSSFLNTPDIDKFHIYPNPIRSTASVELDFVDESNASIEVLDIFGKILLTIANDRIYHKGRNYETIDLANFANGLYVLHIKTQKENRTIKLQVSK